MTWEPRPWQPPMMEHIARHERCAIWAAMGAGKTVATATAVQCAAELDEGPVLVIAPLRVAAKTWPNDIAKWPHLKHLKVSPIIGALTPRLQACTKMADIYTTNYEQIPWLIEYYGNRWPFRTVIADEATRLKNFRTRQGGARAQQLSRVAFDKVLRFIELTGTPSPNGLKDLWGQIWFLDRGRRLGRNYTSFAERWFQRDFDGYGISPTPFAQQLIQDALSDICITIDPKDYMTVDEPLYSTVTVELPRKARDLYRQMEREMFLQIDDSDVEAFNAASRTIKCLQLANGAIYTDEHGTWSQVHDAKLDALESIVEEANGMPVLVAYHFKSDLARLKKRFPHGREFDHNPATEDAWNSGHIPLMFLHPAGAGHGVNLQHGGNIIAFFGHWWDNEQRSQAIERIGPLRQFQSGLDRAVFVYDIVAEDTVDAMVLKRHETKASVQSILLEAMKRKQS